MPNLSVWRPPFPVFYKRILMKKTRLFNLFLGLIAFILVICMGASSNQFLINRQRAVDEMGSFVRDLIIVQDIKGDGLNGIYSLLDPPHENIIIWAEPNWVSPRLGGPPWLEPTKPIKVWLFSDYGLSEAENKAAAIEKYRQDHMNYSTASSFFYGFYIFSILSKSEDHKMAVVYVDVNLGFLESCEDHRYTLQRNLLGQWRILYSEDIGKVR
jgi:hypothetical protein